MIRSRRKRVLGAATAVVVLALGLTAAGSASVRSQAVATKITVTFTDSAFNLSSGGIQAGMASFVPAGTTTFVVVNKGKKLHVLVITGPGLRGVRTPKLAAGGSATLTVTLRAGTYMLSDPVGLGFYNVQYLDVSPGTPVTATGDGSVVTPPLNENYMTCD